MKIVGVLTTVGLALLLTSLWLTGESLSFKIGATGVLCLITSFVMFATESDVKRRSDGA